MSELQDFLGIPNLKMLTAKTERLELIDGRYRIIEASEGLSTFRVKWDDAA